MKISTKVDNELIAIDFRESARQKRRLVLILKDDGRLFMTVEGGPKNVPLTYSKVTIDTVLGVMRILHWRDG